MSRSNPNVNHATSFYATVQSERDLLEFASNRSVMKNNKNNHTLTLEGMKKKKLHEGMRGGVNRGGAGGGRRGGGRGEGGGGGG